MIELVFAILVAIGLVFSIIGSWKALRATPIIGVDEDGYGAAEGLGPIKELAARQRQAWLLLLIGFALQLIGALGFAVLAFCRSGGAA